MPVYPLADHFAEKLHAHTQPRERRTQVKDLLNLSVILEELEDELPTAGVMQQTLEVTCGRYSTHELSIPLSIPPEEWTEPFAVLSPRSAQNPCRSGGWDCLLSQASN